MDIKNADDMKVSFRVMLWYMKRYLKKNYKMTLKDIKDDLDNCGNPVIFELWDITKNTSEKITEDYQKRIVEEFPMAFLWILYRDTAYLPITMYMLKEILDKKDILMPAIEKYYKSPEDWYVNAWHDAKEQTQQLKDEGKIPDFEGVQCSSEQIFTPKIQEEKIKPLIKDIEREFEMKKKNKNYGREFEGIDD